ncbi:hypothetical protein [Halalkalibacter oceani]|uniref:hypothetical protein n=1 Tax=Halalkalibacter oceani TaxID=1653776 RepID=UPI003396EEE4
MPRKNEQINEQKNNVVNLDTSENKKLTEWLGFILDYLSDETNEEIDVEYLFDNAEGLREWWEQYQENNRKIIIEEIKNKLGKLSLEELKEIREKVKGDD